MVGQLGLQRVMVSYSDQETFVARQSEANFGQDGFVGGKCGVLRVSQ